MDANLWGTQQQSKTTFFELEMFQYIVSIKLYINAFLQGSLKTHYMWKRGYKCLQNELWIKSLAHLLILANMFRCFRYIK